MKAKIISVRETSSKDKCSKGHKLRKVYCDNLLSWQSCPRCFPDIFKCKSIINDIEMELDILHQVKTKHELILKYNIGKTKFTRIINPE